MSAHLHSFSAHFFTSLSAVDGGWSPWTPWGQCSVSCGAGLQSRYRFCSNPPQSGSGLPCLGSHREDQVCVTAPCDRQYIFIGHWSTFPVKCSSFLTVFGAGLLAGCCQVMAVGVSGAAGPSAPNRVVGGSAPGGESATAPPQWGRAATVRVWELRSSTVT